MSSDPEDESDGKIYSIPDSPTCPVQTIKNYLKHLNPTCESLFQCPKDENANKFDDNNLIWYANSTVGERTLGNLLRVMTKCKRKRFSKCKHRDPFNQVNHWPQI